MMRFLLAFLAVLGLASCSKDDGKTHIYLQRFFGECGAEYGGTTDVAKAEGECGIMTALINRFNAENPDIRVDVNVVAWPGYPQLAAQMAARDPPDLVTMHTGVISDYAANDLVEPVEPYLKQAGISPNDFTDASLLATTINGRIYGLPWDTHGGLFHVNTALFEKAGLMRGGQTDPAQLSGRTFGARPPIQATHGQALSHPEQCRRHGLCRAQSVHIHDGAWRAALPDPRHIRLQTPEGRKVAEFFKRINQERLGTQNMDTPAAIAAFVSGEGGIYPTGTWMIGSFQQESVTPGRPLYQSYAVFPYPRLWGERVEYVSGHSWVVPKRERNPKAARAPSPASSASWPTIISTGRGPAICPRSRRSWPTRASAAFRIADDIALLAEIGRPLPGYVRRQNAIEGIVGEEMVAGFTGQKPIDVALKQAEDADEYVVR